MKAKQIHRIANEVWLPELSAHGFEEKNGSYLHIFDSGVVHHIAIDKDPHGGETFRLMCGVDAVPLKVGTGLDYSFKKHDGLYHLTACGWDYNSGRWPCVTEEETRASVNALHPLIQDLALPYFAPITTLSDVAEEINEVRMPHLLWMKARLLMLDGNIERAHAAIEKYAQWAAKPRNWGRKESQQEDIERGARVRKEIEEASRSVGE